MIFYNQLHTIYFHASASSNRFPRVSHPLASLCNKLHSGNNVLVIAAVYRSGVAILIMDAIASFRAITIAIVCGLIAVIGQYESILQAFTV